MKRREFFSGLLGAPLVSRAQSLPLREQLLASSEERHVRLGTWCVHWTGFKTARDTPLRTGQWIALPVDGVGDLDRSRWCVYVSVPGQAGTYRPGEVFNLQKQNYEPWALYAPDMRALEAFRVWKLELLLEILGNHDLRYEALKRSQSFEPSAELLESRPREWE